MSAGSETRTDRPTLPKRNPELTKAEHLSPIGHHENGVLRPVDMGWLGVILERYAEAITAVTRGNNRAAGNIATDRCIKAIYETGKPGAGCPPVK